MNAVSEEKPVRRKLGDRRGRPRYDIVGELWGTLETVIRMPLLNVGRGGALVESRVPLAVSSVHKLTFKVGGGEWTADVRIRHVTPSSVGEALLYLIGMEFMSAAPGLLGQIEQLFISSAGEFASAETT
jgi:hypothetical protein